VKEVHASPRAERGLGPLAGLVALGIWLAVLPTARSQVRPYIGFVYPAGGQQGTTFQVKLGGQGLEDLQQALVSGSGVTAKVVEYDRVLNNQETTLLSEQLKELRRGKAEPAAAKTNLAGSAMMMDQAMMASGPEKSATTVTQAAPASMLAARIEKRLAETVNRPASAALASLAYVEVTIAPDAPPGRRELRLATLRGISNPLVFCVGQLPEVCRKPMVTASLQVLGKEEAALRKRPAGEVEDRITLPCVANGQIASGEINQYRFEARKGQHLVITTLARELIPFIADAVPGWFQPVLVLRDDHGREVAYDDDYRFKPDPTLCYEVPRDGAYQLEVYDAIYRGREDFVYRITLGEIPFITSLFPLGGRIGATPTPRMKGWNLAGAELTPPPSTAIPGVYALNATRRDLISNPLPFALDTLTEILEQEPNDTLAQAQKVTLPVIINGRMDRPGDWDVFRFNGKSNDTVVAEVSARRLESPLDSVLKLTDEQGRLIAFNDDGEDLGDGINTHHADSYLMTKLPADGAYFVHLSDTTRNAGDEYGYRLRLSAPQPDFALRVVPSSISLRGKSTAPLSVYVIRKDGFTGPIKLGLKDPPTGFSSAPISLVGTQTVARLIIKTDLPTTPEPITLSVVGTGKIQDREVIRQAVPAEDRMQAFLWRHLVPAEELKAMVFDPSYQPTPKRTPHARPPVMVASNESRTNKPPVILADVSTNKPAAPSTGSGTNKSKFTKQQVAGRLRQLKLLYEEGLITDDFYDEKVGECEAAL